MPCRYGHQMTVTSFKVTDISDPADMPTTYCGGAAGAFCDAGVTGLCLAVAASGVCEKAVGGTKFDVTNLDTFTYVADDSVSGCLWTYGAHGYLSHASSANRDQGTALGECVRSFFLHFLRRLQRHGTGDVRGLCRRNGRGSP